MKKLFTVLSMVLIAAFMLTACAPAATPAPTAAPTEAPKATEAPMATKAPEATATVAATEAPMGVKGKIVLWHSLKDNETASLNEVIALFQKANPDVKFEVLFVPNNDIKGKFETAAGSGGGPSLLWGAADWGTNWYNAKLVADISKMVSPDLLPTINEAALSSVKYSDAIIGLPVSVKGVVMFRNKKIIADAPATFDDLVKAAKAATKGDVVGADLEYGFFFSAGHLVGMGGTFMDAKGDPTFNDDKGVAWVEQIKKFKDAGPVENYTDNDVNLFKAGKAGIIIDGSWNAAGLATAIGKENLVIDPWPSPLNGFVQNDTVYLSENVTGDDQMASEKFLEYLLSPEAQKVLADPAKAGLLPSIKGVTVDDPLASQAGAVFAKGVAFPVIPEMGAYWDPMNNMLKKVLETGADPKASLQEAFDAITAKVKEIRGAK